VFEPRSIYTYGNLFPKFEALVVSILDFPSNLGTWIFDALIVLSLVWNKGCGGVSNLSYTHL
jgi:hypothetical protein